jgi:Domain of unknown function (DUF4129)
MKRGISQIAILLFAAFLLLPARASAGNVSLAEYRGQLQELAAKIDSLGDHPERAAATEAELPDKVTVADGKNQITVSYRGLKDDLASFSRADAQKRSALLVQMRNYLQALRAEAEAYAQGQDNEAARGKLTGILARSEFRKNRGGSSAGEVLLSKILGWLSRLIDRFSFARSSRFDLFQILIYVLVAAALVLLVIWTLRHFRRSRREPAMREIIPFSPSARSWRAWLAEARALAQQQDWRGAIHLAYWAGISFLEEHGAWKPDRARTPREYLQLVGLRSSRYLALATLTRKFEVVWYGHRDAAESDFQETLGQLEKLGCL